MIQLYEVVYLAQKQHVVESVFTLFSFYGSKIHFPNIHNTKNMLFA